VRSSLIAESIGSAAALAGLGVDDRYSAQRVVIEKRIALSQFAWMNLAGIADVDVGLPVQTLGSVLMGQIQPTTFHILGAAVCRGLRLDASTGLACFEPHSRSSTEKVDALCRYR
jgi:hypothetical protein